ncbi:hypothetical protein [Halobaculum sp. P14]|uniref:hypothetical protein n=1 Tax=Halobaculum sp. P14 TaxID=3421638 RepID=UPI003EBFB25F
MANTSEWRTDATEPVIRLLYQSGVAVSPAGVLANLEHRMDDPPSRQDVLSALAALSGHGYVRQLGDVEAHYIITERGKDFVETEVDQDGVGFID